MTIWLLAPMRPMLAASGPDRDWPHMSTHPSGSVAPYVEPTIAAKSGAVAPARVPVSMRSIDERCAMEPTWIPRTMVELLPYLSKKRDTDGRFASLTMTWRS